MTTESKNLAALLTDYVDAPQFDAKQFVFIFIFLSVSFCRPLI